MYNRSCGNGPAIKDDYNHSLAAAKLNDTRNFFYIKKHSAHVCFVSFKNTAMLGGRVGTNCCVYPLSYKPYKKPPTFFKVENVPTAETALKTQCSNT